MKTTGTVISVANDGMSMELAVPDRLGRQYYMGLSRKNAPFPTNLMLHKVSEDSITVCLTIVILKSRNVAD